MHRFIVHQILKTAKLLQEHFLIRGDDSTFRPIAIRLVLGADDSHQVRIILHEYHLRMVHGQIHRIEAALHFTIEFHRLIRGLQVCQQYGMTDQPFFPQVIETTQESVRRRERRNIDVRTPGLLQDPVQQTERV